MDTAFLDRLAHHRESIRFHRVAGRSIRTFEQIKKRYEDGKYDTPFAAESDFREFVKNELGCRNDGKE
jgi:hypothetical protein